MTVIGLFRMKPIHTLQVPFLSLMSPSLNNYPNRPYFLKNLLLCFLDCPDFSRVDGICGNLLGMYNFEVMYLYSFEDECISPNQVVVELKWPKAMTLDKNVTLLACDAH